MEINAGNSFDGVIVFKRSYLMSGCGEADHFVFFVSLVRCFEVRRYFLFNNKLYNNVQKIFCRDTVAGSNGV